MSGKTGSLTSPSFGSTSLSLLERVKAREPLAWTQLVDLYGPLVYHWCHRCDLTPEDAGDLVQEVFIAISLSIDGFRKEGRSGTFRGWLRTITLNKVRDRIRRAQRDPRGVGGSAAKIRIEQIDAELSAPQSAVDELRNRTQVLSRAIELVKAEFEPNTWTAFWSSAVEGTPTAEIAETLGMTPAAVRKAKSRVLMRLRVELRSLEEF